MAKDGQWTTNCVLFGASLFKRLSKGQISREAALAEIRGLTSVLTEEGVTYLLGRLNELVYS